MTSVVLVVVSVSLVPRMPVLIDTPPESSVGTTVVATVIGWGLVTNTLSSALAWQGFLLEPLGLGPKVNGPWSFANLGVLVALVLGFAAQFAFGRARVRRQEVAAPQTASPAGATP